MYTKCKKHKYDKTIPINDMYGKKSCYSAEILAYRNELVKSFKEQGWSPSKMSAKRIIDNIIK